MNVQERIDRLNQQIRELGGKGSGDFGHSGRPGEVGGSGEGSGNRESGQEEIGNHVVKSLPTGNTEQADKEVAKIIQNYLDKGYKSDRHDSNVVIGNGQRIDVYWSHQFDIEKGGFQGIDIMKRVETPSAAKSKEYEKEAKVLDKVGFLFGYGYGSSDLNSSLREGKIDDQYKEQIRQMDKLMAKSTLNKDIVTYRWVPKETVKDNSVEKGYTSVSRTKVGSQEVLDLGEGMAGWDPRDMVQMEITVPKGTNYINVNKELGPDYDFGNQREYIFPRNSTITITGRSGGKIQAKLTPPKKGKK